MFQNSQQRKSFDYRYLTLNFNCGSAGQKRNTGILSALCAELSSSPPFFPLNMLETTKYHICNTKLLEITYFWKCVELTFLSIVLTQYEYTTTDLVISTDVKLKWNTPRFLAQHFRWSSKLVYT